MVLNYSTNYGTKLHSDLFSNDVTYKKYKIIYDISFYPYYSSLLQNTRSRIVEPNWFTFIWNVCLKQWTDVEIQ